MELEWMEEGHALTSESEGRATPSTEEGHARVSTDHGDGAYVDPRDGGDVGPIV